MKNAVCIFLSLSLYMCLNSVFFISFYSTVVQVICRFFKQLVSWYWRNNISIINDSIVVSGFPWPTKTKHVVLASRNSSWRKSMMLTFAIDVTTSKLYCSCYTELVSYYRAMEMHFIDFFFLFFFTFKAHLIICNRDGVYCASKNLLEFSLEVNFAYRNYVQHKLVTGLCTLYKIDLVSFISVFYQLRSLSGPVNYLFFFLGKKMQLLGNMDGFLWENS